MTIWPVSVCSVLLRPHHRTLIAQLRVVAWYSDNFASIPDWYEVLSSPLFSVFRDRYHPPLPGTSSNTVRNIQVHEVVLQICGLLKASPRKYDTGFNLKPIETNFSNLKQTPFRHVRTPLSRSFLWIISPGLLVRLQLSFLSTLGSSVSVGSEYLPRSGTGRGARTPVLLERWPVTTSL